MYLLTSELLILLFHILNITYCHNITSHYTFKAHDVRAFAVSKAFHTLDQILSTRHWKSDNTFTHIYLMDFACAESEIYHIGGIVAGQQVCH